MILLSVGQSNPFNRLARTVDAWANLNDQNAIFGQIGTATYQPQNFEHIDFFANDASRDAHYAKANLLICDLSREVLLPAIEHELPVLALPRLSIFGEETGINQSTLAQHLKSDDFITIAKDEQQLHELLSMPRVPFSKNIAKNYALSCNRTERSTRLQTVLADALREVG